MLHLFLAGWYDDVVNAEGMARHLRLRGAHDVELIERQKTRQPFAVLYAAERPFSDRHRLPDRPRAVR